MNQNILKVSVKSWLVFFLILLMALLYGVVIRDKNSTDNHSQVTVNDAKVSLSDPLPLRQTRAPDVTAQQAPLRASGYAVTAEVKREAVLMGSQFVFIVEGPKQHALSAITEAANAIKKLEAQLSSWQPNSDISRLNDRAGRHRVNVSPETLKLLQLAKDLSQKTLGAFDITVGAVWDIWPFRNRQQQIPTQQKIAQQLKLVGAANIEIDLAKSTAYLPQKGMKVNLGAIGKGYAAGLAIAKMKALGIEQAAVSAGGDIYLLGEKKSGPWVVELEHPRWPGRYLDRFVAGDIAVATSGDAKQYIEKNGKRYSHIIDPRTGWPTDDCQSVTIATQSATEADAFATAVYVMGTTRGMDWVESQQGLEALIVDKKGQLHKSSGWAALTKKYQDSPVKQNQLYAKDE